MNDLETDPDLIRELTLKAYDRYHVSARWLWIIVLTLGLVHLLTVSPFILATAEVERRSGDIEDLRNLTTQVQATVDAIAAEQKTTASALRGRLDTLLTDLISDFAALQSVVDAVRSGQAITTTDDPDFSVQAQRPAPANLAVQTPLLPSATIQEDVIVAPAWFDIRDESLIEQVRAVETALALRSLLAPLVDKHIIQPRFATVNTAWQTELAPQLHARTTEVIDLLDTERARVSLTKETHATITADIGRYDKALRDIAFSPPADDPVWWYSIKGKGDKVSDFKLKAERNIVSEAPFETVAEQLLRSLSREVGLISALEAEIKSLQAQFSLQQDWLSRITGGLAIPSVDLTQIVRVFPLLLGVALGGAITWQTRRRIEVAAFLRAAPDIPRQVLQAITQTPDRRAVRIALTFVLLLGSLCWIGFAGWELSRLRDQPGADPVILAIAGAIAVVAAFAHRLWSLKEPLRT